MEIKSPKKPALKHSQRHNQNPKRKERNAETMENTETYLDTAQTDTELNQTENPAESQTETQGETLTYNTDEIFGVSTEMTGSAETQTSSTPMEIQTTTAVQPIAETAYIGVTSQQFEEYSTENRLGTIVIIFILAMILGAIIGQGFSKIWRM